MERTAGGGSTTSINEALREAACIGNIDSTRKLLQLGADVNSQNSINGWAPLHWACKRGYRDIVKYLIDSGANPSIQTFKGEYPNNLTADKSILNLLPEGDGKLSQPDLPILPNYLRNPEFPYSDISQSLMMKTQPPSVALATGQSSQMNYNTTTKVKVRIADSDETDFVEVDIKELTYNCLLRSCCEELEVPLDEVAKLRKLPNVLIRKDKDVTRLKNEQELELVLKGNMLSDERT